MEKYIGFKMIEAEPMTKKDFEVQEKGKTFKELQDEDNQHGYKVKYSDSYVSWSPKNVFEKAYMQVGDNNTITQENVDSFIVDYETFTKKDKITIVIATLVNGFTIVESSACVDKANYNETLGAEICKERIKNKVWNYLGFLLQTAKDGIK